jgi:hypothetical protein
MNFFNGKESAVKVNIKPIREDYYQLKYFIDKNIELSSFPQ